MGRCCFTKRVPAALTAPEESNAEFDVWPWREADNSVPSQPESQLRTRGHQISTRDSTGSQDLQVRVCQGLNDLPTLFEKRCAGKALLRPQCVLKLWTPRNSSTLLGRNKMTRLALLQGLGSSSKDFCLQRCVGRLATSFEVRIMDLWTICKSIYFVLPMSLSPSSLFRLSVSLSLSLSCSLCLFFFVCCVTNIFCT